MIKLARSEGLEPPTPWFEAKYSIQLSYERLWKMCCQAKPDDGLFDEPGLNLHSNM